MSSPEQNTPAHALTSNASAPARRFAPVPIETTTTSSRTRKHSPEKEEAPKIRRFAPQPIETSTKSSRAKEPAPVAEQKPAIRRFAPQPIETTQKSSKHKSQASSGHIRFSPQLVETTYGGNRKSSSHASSRKPSQDGDGASIVASEEATPRKFTPVVLSTARRSRRAGDSNAANYRDHKTEEGHTIHAREHQRHAGWKTPDQTSQASSDKDHHMSLDDLDAHPELRRQTCNADGSVAHRPGLIVNERKHSFRCPELDTIESSESERDSGHSSMSVSPERGSPITASDSSFNEYYKHATRIRESVDENFSHYLLQLEAKKAKQRLQEAALAAFPNSDFHEPVQHYVNEEQDSTGSDMEIEDRPVTWAEFDEEEFLSAPPRFRRESTGRIPWEQLEMQRHAEQREQERNANRPTEKKKESHSPWWNPAAGATFNQPDNEMRSMRDRARPPMLGNDLVFPRCPSPEPARFDVTQGSAQLRQQMCYLSQQSQSESQKAPGGLWNAPATKSDQSVSSAAAKSPAKSNTPGKGLWGGFCVGQEQNAAAGGLSPPVGPTGLMTPAPRAENVNPFEQSFADRNGGVSIAPPTPPESVDMNRLDAMLMSEKQMEEQIENEFPDGFVTQVYNYLSLGYPSLARPFDEELSKIAGVPVKELREDDIKAKQSPKGYIRLGPDFEGGGGVLKASDCKRWQALKLYIHEWARQEKNMVPADATGGNWATVNRRGSWAI
ncbi:hypothetical protein AC579_3654 [Pseudocercospora musae]|uniref:Uncharacterized protein n=1 Tax=Pseudocercospora musae TaxID=113226 RepID=A0A139IIX8_9PEZI|nr:hypothetical protein AC579_3654 [Pseudocercospora musae]